MPKMISSACPTVPKRAQTLTSRAALSSKRRDVKLTRPEVRAAIDPTNATTRGADTGAERCSVTEPRRPRGLVDLEHELLRFVLVRVGAALSQLVTYMCFDKRTLGYPIAFVPNKLFLGGQQYPRTIVA